jgi:hypothetical protein
MASRMFGCYDSFARVSRIVPRFYEVLDSPILSPYFAAVKSHERGQIPGVGDKQQLHATTAKVRQLKRNHSRLQILASHDPEGAGQLRQASGDHEADRPPLLIGRDAVLNALHRELDDRPGLVTSLSMLSACSGSYELASPMSHLVTLDAVRPTPLSQPRAWSAEESSRIIVESKARGGSGGRSAGLNARYPCGCFTNWPARVLTSAMPAPHSAWTKQRRR